MIDRRRWLAAGVLAVVVAAQSAVWLLRPRVEEEAFSGPPRSDYTLTDFTLHALGADGTLSFSVSGPRLARRGDDGSIYVSTPSYVLFDGNGNPWNGTSESAWVSKDGSLMRLEGAVEMHRDASATEKAARIVTADLLCWPKDKKLQTEAPTQITQPGSILRGTGMRGDLNSKVLELLSDVHNTFEPTRKRR